jgi:hypothetical protein
MRKAPHNTLSVLLDIAEATGATQVFLNHLYGEWTHHLPELILSSSLSLCLSVSLSAALDFGPQHIPSFPRVFFAKCSASVSECPLTEK